MSEEIKYNLDGSVRKPPGRRKKLPIVPIINKIFADLEEKELETLSRVVTDFRTPPPIEEKPEQPEIRKIRENKDMIRYYVIDKRNPELVTKGAADSVALMIAGNDLNTYVVVKSGDTDRVVDISNGTTYNKLVTILNKA